MNLVLLRYQYSDSFTFGVFFVDKTYIADSLELPPYHNAPYVSSIPEGTYKIKWSSSGHEVGECYEVLDVPGREGILIHPANSVRELQGCIAPGQRYADMVWHSVSALRKLYQALGSEADLTVRRIDELL